MFAFSIASFMRRVPTRFRPSPLQSFSCSLRFLACALARRTAAPRSVAESGPRSGVYSTQNLGADLTEQILIQETVGSPEVFFFLDISPVGGPQRSPLLAEQPLYGL